MPQYVTEPAIGDSQTYSCGIGDEAVQGKVKFFKTDKG
jgi:hypothetical protein